MEQWSILSNYGQYIWYDRHPKIFYNLNIRAVNKEKYKWKLDTEEEEMLELDFGDLPDKLKEEYLDIYDSIQLELLSTTRFDEKFRFKYDILRKSRYNQSSKIKVEETFLISEQGHTIGKLLGGTECQILLDTGACKSFISESHYLHCKSLHLLPKFASKTQRIQVGNGQFVSVLFIIPLIVDIHGHKFKVLYLSIRNTWECRF